MKVHQIWQGDSVELCQRFKEGSVDCIITDPPFGVDNLSNMAVTEAGKKYATKIANDESPEVAIKVFKDVMSVLLPKTKEHSDLYVFTSYQVLSDWLVMLDEFAPQFGFNRKAVLVWEKDGPGMGDLESWGQGHEFILYFKKGRAPRYAKRRNGVLHIPQLRPNQLIHPHEKPTALLEILIRHSTKEGAFLVDPFGGSGSLVRAARNCGRNAVAIELDPARYEASARKLESEGDDLFADL
ncbi:DNA methylase [Gordonia phage Woes]|uniref:DNA methylase n=3 Tax=Woesvirus woes TaxID=1982751 RepID=A0A411B4P2_9CAUD|nr:DNA methyltransferase [Gordonia phage Woes]ANA85817.1 DNA methylase [Gordonia phage Woes]QAX95315.1 DNA methylase [Gordonia phage Hello]QAX95407.1 DNA methylase [Gordonia phage Neoevie]